MRMTWIENFGNGTVSLNNFCYGDMECAEILFKSSEFRASVAYEKSN